MSIERQEGNAVTVYLGLGANLGNRQQNISRAIEMLSRRVHVEQVSSYYETEPEGYSQQPRFLNAVCEATTTLAPEELLSTAKEIEAAMGRKPSFRDAPRPIDVDILFYGERVIRSPQLVVPHPHVEERAFVLVPLEEIASELAHPVSGRTVKEMLRDLGTIEGVTKWKEAKDV
jgi:GTP cyclohydrolase-4